MIYALIISVMKIIRCIFMCALCGLLSDCIFGAVETGDVVDTGLSKATLSVQPGNATVAVSWDAIADVSGYQLYKTGAIDPSLLADIDLSSMESSSDVTARFDALGISNESIAVTDVTYTDESLTNGMAYCYVVTGVRNGEGVPSDGACEVPMGAPVTQAVAGSGSALVSFLRVPGAVGYNLYSQVASPSISLPLPKANGDVAGNEWEWLMYVEDTTGSDVLEISVEITGLSNCVDYYIIAKAVNINGHESDDAQSDSASPSAAGNLRELIVRENLGGNEFIDIVRVSDEIVAFALNDGFSVYDMAEGTWRDKRGVALDTIYAIASDGLDAIYLAGQVGTNEPTAKVCKYSLDTLADEGCFSDSTLSSARDVVVAPSGDLYVAGSLLVSSGRTGGYRLAIWHLVDDQPDDSFPDGVMFTGAYGYASKVSLIEYDGSSHVIAVGLAYECPNPCATLKYRVIVAEGNQVGGDYPSSPTPPSTADGPIVTTLNPGSDNSSAMDVIQLSGGDILTLGITTLDTDIFIWTDNSDLSPELTYAYGIGPTQMYQIMTDCRNRVVLAGKVRTAAKDYDVTVWRLAGSTLEFDPLFSDNGSFVYGDSTSIEGARAIAETVDGLYLVAGLVEVSGQTYPALLVVE